jgi:hypothetical protein
MADTRFTATLYVDKQGFLTGQVRIPSDHLVALEALNECVLAFAKATKKSHHEVLSDLMRLHNGHERKS